MGEFADVRTGAERFAPRARHHEGAHALVARDVAAGGQQLVEGDKGGEVERRVVEGKHHDAATLQTVVDEGALRHDQILPAACSFRFDVRGLDDWPPPLDLRLVICGERRWRLLLARGY